MKIKRALVSVYDKDTLADFAETLAGFGVEILSSGGTAKFLRDQGLDVMEISDYTGSPEILDGRVKTIHPKIAAGILAVRDNPAHMQQLVEHDIQPIDMVVVNLYPFLQFVGERDKSHEEMIELIDIGGPTLIRSAAKNAAHVAVVTSPCQYGRVADALREKNGGISSDLRLELSTDAFRLTAYYDGMIADYLSEKVGCKDVLASRRVFPLQKTAELRYGENPHQKAGYYQVHARSKIEGIGQLHGIDLSYNNLLDTEAALSALSDFDAPTVVIIKHNNPCGIGSGEELTEAYEKALAVDPVSAFGGIMSVNRTFSAVLAEKIKTHFLEVVLAPDFDPEALSLLQRKKKLRILKYFPKIVQGPKLCIRNVLNGFLFQESDQESWSDSELKVVSRRGPTTMEMKSLAFAWRAVKHVKSNAIVFGGSDRLLAVGAGQMSRVDSVELAISKARKAGLSLEGSVMASDAFFPFRDGIDVAAKAGTTAVVQPGGSIRDNEVIDAANEHGMAMIFTGIRHFRH